MKNKVTVDEWVKRFRAIGLDEAAMQNGIICSRRKTRKVTKAFWNGWDCRLRR